MEEGVAADIFGLVGLESQLVELVNAAVIVVDLRGRVVNANRYVETLYGWRPEELIGKESSAIAAEVLDPAVRDEISAAVVAGSSYEGIFSVRRKDGTVIYVRAIDSPLYDRAGKLIGILSIGLDASREQRMEQRLGEQTRAADEYKFLAECTTALASALDYAGGIRALARISAAFLGDICLIDATSDGAIRRMAAAHRDPARQPLVDELMQFLPDPTGRHPAVRAIREGASAYSETMGEDYLRDTTKDADHLRIVRELGFESFLCVPLVARGRILGALTLISCSPDRRYGPSDLRLAEEMAWRAALGLDTARLFEERTRVAQVLQASLLPPSLPQIPGARLAARYLSAEEGLDVGGDFYDVFDAGYGSWAISIGDVCGRGPQAATVTGLVRHTVRSLAVRERDPAQLLRSLNGVLHRDLREPGMFCTVCYGLLRPRPDGLHVRLASGGHPAPLVVRADGTLDEVACSGLMLGPFESGDWPRCPVTLKPGDTLIFYTDGVSEAQRDGVQFDDGAFQEAARRLAGADPQVIADTIVDAACDFAAGVSHDDMAVLVVQAVTRI